MFTFNSSAGTDQQRKQLLKLQRQMKSLKNEMEFVEILAQFWPMPNMYDKMERLDKRMRALSREYETRRNGLVPKGNAA